MNKKNRRFILVLVCLSIVCIAIASLQVFSMLAPIEFYGQILRSNGVDTSKGIKFVEHDPFTGKSYAFAFARVIWVSSMTEQERQEALARHQIGGYGNYYLVSIFGHCERIGYL